MLYILDTHVKDIGRLCLAPPPEAHHMTYTALVEDKCKILTFSQPLLIKVLQIQDVLDLSVIADGVSHLFWHVAPVVASHQLQIY